VTRRAAWLVAAAGLAAALGVGTWLTWGASPRPPADAGRAPVLGAEAFFGERDRFLPVTDPGTVPAAEAGWLVPDDEVFGVVVRGHARAYPIPMIAYHHVVNDVIEGVPVAVTY